MRSHPPLIVICVAILMIVLSLTACGASPTPANFQPSSESPRREQVSEPATTSGLAIETFIAYQPPFLPIRFVATDDGIEVESSVEIVTPIGTFQIGATAPLISSQVDVADDGITVIFINREAGTEQSFFLRGQERLRATLNGENILVDVDAGRNTITIDIKEGDIVEISSNADLPTCADALPSNLKVGMMAIVSRETNIREIPYVPNDDEPSNIRTVAKADEVVEIINGVACEYNGYWWEVRTGSGAEGWMKEATNGQVLLAPQAETVEEPPLPAQPDNWEMDVTKGEGLNLLVGDIGISGQTIVITDPWGNREEVTSGSKPEFGTGGFETYQHGAGDYRIEFLNQSFTVPLDDQFTRVTFTRG